VRETTSKQILYPVIIPVGSARRVHTVYEFDRSRGVDLAILSVAGVLQWIAVCANSTGTVELHR